MTADVGEPRWKSLSIEIADIQECGRLVAPVTCEPPLAVPGPRLAVGQDPSCGDIGS